MAEIAGSVTDGTLPTALRDIYVGRRSGVLHFSRASERLGVHFVKGHISYAESHIESAHLGEFLVAQGLLSAADRARAAVLVASTGKRMGAILEGMGLLDQDQLRDVLALYVREILLRAFSWNEGTFALDESAAAPPPQYDLTLKLSTGEMILAAARSLTNRDAIRHGLGNLDRILFLSTDPLLRFQKVALTPADGFLLSRVDGRSSAKEILKIIPLPAEEVEQSLFGLLCTGLVEYLPLATTEPPPQWEELRQEVLDTSRELARRTHYQVLGVPRYAPESVLQAAYYRLAKRYHPDAQHHPRLADLRDGLEALFVRAREAYDTLRNPQARAAYEEQLARASRSPDPPAPPPPEPEEEVRRLEEIYKKAQERFAERKFWEVVGMLEALAPLAQGRLRHKARVLLAQTYFKNPQWRREAEVEMLGVLEEAPDNVDARFALAEMYRDWGQREKAIEAFREVLQLRPKHREATSELAELTRPEAGSFLKRLLGR